MEETNQNNNNTNINPDKIIKSGVQDLTPEWTRNLGVNLRNYILKNFPGNAKELGYALEVPRAMIKTASYLDGASKIVAIGEYIKAVQEQWGNPGGIAKATMVEGVAIIQLPFIDELYKQGSNLAMRTPEFALGAIYAFGEQARGFLKASGHTDIEINGYIKTVEKYKQYEKQVQSSSSGNSLMTDDQYLEYLREQFKNSSMTEDQYFEYLKNLFKTSGMTEEQQAEYLKNLFGRQGGGGSTVKVSSHYKYPNGEPVPTNKLHEYMSTLVNYEPWNGVWNLEASYNTTGTTGSQQNKQNSSPNFIGPFNSYTDMMGVQYPAHMTLQEGVEYNDYGYSSGAPLQGRVEQDDYRNFGVYGKIPKPPNSSSLQTGKPMMSGYQSQGDLPNSVVRIEGIHDPNSNYRQNIIQPDYQQAANTIGNSATNFLNNPSWRNAANVAINVGIAAGIAAVCFFLGWKSIIKSAKYRHVQKNHIPDSLIFPVSEILKIV